MMKRGTKIILGAIAVVVAAALILAALFFLRRGNAESDASSIPILREQPESVTLLTDIQYQETEGNNCYLDVAFRDDGEAKPLLVLVHGGSWISGAKEEMNALLYTFSSLGYTAASIDYDLLDPASALQGDCFSIADEEACVAAAVDYLAQHAGEYQIDTGRVVLLGHSAGGQLVGRLAERIADHPEDYAFEMEGVVLLAAASDLRYYLYNNLSADGINASFVEGSFIFDGVYGTDVIPEINKVDVLYNLTENLPPVLILQGSDDTYVPVSMSQNLYDALEAIGVTAELTIIPGAGHNILENETAFSEIHQFLEQYVSNVGGE